MNRQRFASSAMFLAVLTPLGFTLQDPPPRPDPAPAPAPATRPAQDQEAKQKEERARQERLERERKEEARKQAEAQRLQEQERARRAREEAQAREGAATRTPAQNNEMRDTARNLFEVERLHRSHVARIERLMEIYRESGDRAKLVELEQLRAKADKRYEKFVARYKEEMGPAFAQVQPHLEAGKARTSTRPKRPNSNTGGGQ